MSPEAEHRPRRALRTDELQRWFLYQVTRRHLTDDAPLEPSFEPDVISRPISDVILPSATLSAEQRMDIYANMYFWRLLGALASDFPALKTLMGTDAFEALIRGYFTKHPSRSYSLDNIGRSLPDFIRSAGRWPNTALLADIAAVESAVCLSFSAKDTPLLAPEALQTIPPERWGEVCFKTSAGLHLFALDHAVNSILRRVRDGENITDEDRALTPSWVVVWRREQVVWRQVIDEPRYQLLAALQRGETMGEAIERAAAVWSDDETHLEDLLFRWFSGWVAEGYFSGLDLS